MFMAWFKVDDGFWSHPKTVACGTEAIALWVRAGAWSCQQLTDGVVPDYVLPMFQSSTDVADRLVDVGYWRRVEGGYSFHDWGEYQEDSVKVKERRKAARDRMRAARDARSKKGGSQDVHANNDGTDYEQDAHVRDLFADCSPNPDPTRPDPTRPTSPKGEGPSDTIPKKFCPKHPSGTAEPCWACKSARESYEKWQKDKPQDCEHGHHLVSPDLGTCLRCGVRVA